MALHDTFIKVITDKTLEAAERAVVDIIVRKLRAQSVTVSKATRDGIERAVRAREFSTIRLPDPAVPAGRRQPKLSITKADLRVLNRIESRLRKSLPRIVEAETTKLAPRLLNDLIKRWPDQATSEQESLALFQRHQWRRWRKGLSRLAMMLTITRELGGQLAAQYSATPDRLPHVLIRLHARACTVADEVLTLLQAGFADAAMARWRTLHEIAVTSLFLQEHGETAAERFLAHEAIDELKAARLHQKHARRLGLKRLHRRDIDRLKRIVRKRIATFGPGFRSPYGWAANGPSDHVRGFDDVERRTSLSHWRPSYKAASHQVHATPNAMFEWIAVYGSDGPLGGRSMLGVADPGQRTAISLNQVTAAVATCGKPSPTFDTVLTLKILRLACTEAINDFIEAHRKQQRLLAKHRRRTPRRR
ncbi:MAG: hypothetical protein GEU99_06555 [Luteitalea sp.]|nr:hypothetical protein [Luteitalea sp.]